VLLQIDWLVIDVSNYRGTVVFRTKQSTLLGLLRPEDERITVEMFVNLPMDTA
jgi:hypothetical protein